MCSRGGGGTYKSARLARVAIGLALDERVGAVSAVVIVAVLVLLDVVQGPLSLAGFGLHAAGAATAGAGRLAEVVLLRVSFFSSVAIVIVLIIVLILLVGANVAGCNFIALLVDQTLALGNAAALFGVVHELAGVRQVALIVGARLSERDGADGQERAGVARVGADHAADGGVVLGAILHDGGRDQVALGDHLLAEAVELLLEREAGHARVEAVGDHLPGEVCS